ncbi:Hypothetical_protein [Hexamita inflata]|uniref:Hypothetical_protein n=1 Tax=Hexamita inflata TaxID=28002 RepID=A0AA86V874_9EUKA|nr:Hypothetical protein HINF_LOCUS46668 [Hexamita inflata]
MMTLKLTQLIIQLKTTLSGTLSKQIFKMRSTNSPRLNQVSTRELSNKLTGQAIYLQPPLVTVGGRYSASKIRGIYRRCHKLKTISGMCRPNTIRTRRKRIQSRNVRR